MTIPADSSEHKMMIDALKSLDSKVDKTNVALEDHVEHGHDGHITREEIEGWINKVSAWIDESKQDREGLRVMHHNLLTQHTVIVDMFLGEPKVSIDGVVFRKGGFKDIVSEYMEGSQGFRVNIPWAKMSAVIVASITTAGLIIVAVIERL